MSSKYGSLMDEFAQWGTNLKFNTALEEWMEDNCKGFEDAEFGKEQKLEWGQNMKKKDKADFSPLGLERYIHGISLD